MPRGINVSPRLFGRRFGDGNKALIDGVELDGQPLELSSARRHGSHLFLRYAVLDSLTRRADKPG